MQNSFSEIFQHHTWLLEQRLRRSELEEALTHCQACLAHLCFITVDQEAIENLQSLKGLFYLLLGRVETALNIFSAVDEKVLTPVQRLGLVASLISTGETDRAMALASKQCENPDRFVDSLMHLGVDAQSRGKVELASKLYEFLLFCFENFGVILLVTYRRDVMYSMLALAPLAGVGLYYFIEFLYTFIQKKMPHFYKEVKPYLAVFLIALMLVIFIPVFQDYYNLLPGTKLYKVIDNSDYNAIKFLGGVYGEHNVVLSLPHISSAIYPLSKNYVVAVRPAQVPGGEYKEIYDFFEDITCIEKDNIVKKYDVDFILSKKMINCSGLREVYSQNNYIYEII